METGNSESKIGQITKKPGGCHPDRSEGPMHLPYMVSYRMQRSFVTPSSRPWLTQDDKVTGREPSVLSTSFRRTAGGWHNPVHPQILNHLSVMIKWMRNSDHGNSKTSGGSFAEWILDWRD